MRGTYGSGFGSRVLLEGFMGGTRKSVIRGVNRAIMG